MSGFPGTYEVGNTPLTQFNRPMRNVYISRLFDGRLPDLVRRLIEELVDEFDMLNNHIRASLLPKMRNPQQQLQNWDDWFATLTPPQ